MKNAIILCSGGLDSVTTSYFVKRKLGYDKLKILFFDYGQRNFANELAASKKCALDLGAEFFNFDVRYLGGISKSMLNSKGSAEEIKLEDLKDSKEESGKWYVPCRNLIFLSNALAFAESLKEESDIFVGFKCEGSEGFPDATKEFVDSLNKVSAISTNGKFVIKAPLISKDKEDIVLLAEDLGVNFEETWSCYVGGEVQCGTCLACRLRQEGFYWANVKDPSSYLARTEDFRKAK